MQIKEYLEKSAKIKPGTYFKICYKSNGKKSGYKIVNTYARFIFLAELGATQTKFTMIAKNVYQTSKSTITYLHTSKSPNLKSKVEYFDCNGIAIDKEQFEQINGITNYAAPLDIFSKRIEDIISIG